TAKNASAITASAAKCSPIRSVRHCRQSPRASAPAPPSNHSYPDIVDPHWAFGTGQHLAAEGRGKQRRDADSALQQRPYFRRRELGMKRGTEAAHPKITPNCPVVSVNLLVARRSRRQPRRSIDPLKSRHAEQSALPRIISPTGRHPPPLVLGRRD